MQEETLYEEVETESEFTYLGGRVSAGCEIAVTAKRRCGWVRFGVCGDLLYGRRFRLRLKGAVYGSHVWPAMLYGSEASCLKEGEMGILRRTERSMEKAMRGVQLKDRKRSADLMVMLSL